MDMLEAARRLLAHRGYDAFVRLLARSRASIGLAESKYGGLWFYIYAPLHDYEALRSLEDAQRSLILRTLQEVRPDNERGDGGLERIWALDFRLDTSSLPPIRADLFAEPTGWAKVDRQLADVRESLQQARGPQDLQKVGIVCREALISAVQEVFDPSLHIPDGGDEPSKTDFKRMAEHYIGTELQGPQHQVVRKFARRAVELATAAFDLANAVQHDRSAQYRTAALCAEATFTVINLLAVLAGRRERAAGKDV